MSNSEMEVAFGTYPIRVGASLIWTDTLSSLTGNSTDSESQMNVFIHSTSVHWHLQVIRVVVQYVTEN